MEAGLARYIWKHTWANQVWILLVVAVSMVPYFMSFDLPKRIVNGPIQGAGFERPGATQTFLDIAFDLPFIGKGTGKGEPGRRVVGIASKALPTTRHGVSRSPRPPIELGELGERQRSRVACQTLFVALDGGCDCIVVADLRGLHHLTPPVPRGRPAHRPGRSRR